jgi:uncharacterized protein (DUF1501 family)
MSDPGITTRREFLRGLTLAGVSATVPAFVVDAARAMTNPLESVVSSRPGVSDDRVLVFIQLAGGNDGLNTIVPYTNDNYYANRPQLAIPAKDVLKLRGGLGLHPSARGLKDLYDDGRMTVVQGVGYPNPNRSHFVSTDIWHRGAPDGEKRGGWIGRYFDHACSGADPAPADSAIALTQEAPLAFQGRGFSGVAFTDVRSLRWSGAEPLNDAFEALNRADGAESPRDGRVSFLTRIAMDARASAAKIEKAMQRRVSGDFPTTAFGRSMAGISKMIAEGLPTRVYYASLGGFDTHSGQLGRHARLMFELGRTMKAFLDDLQQQGNLGRVLVVTFSEFGRRVAQNASGGTDHGEAAPAFLFGGGVKPGIFGRHPSLKKLHRGDLAFGVDFRQIYADILDDWLASDSRAVLGRRFRSLGLVDAEQG